MNPDKDGTLVVTAPLNASEATTYIIWCLHQFYGYTNNPAIVN